ncbi:bifunctional diaminohydroxyphosphoribosylaminopyrimidine deaminase/5-amino-6-(5-phosphoribosylamino)uracil reductase RibD [Alteromonas ponticola]|uniref:Riboflavin biosynthesis protein RibD n=1 Tax=Alteromonas ponticola TaxID=2720613 RepID=A0ABX1R0W5_9ALTE|nr:bifunctional diaminohydroxyphosphoribosylaminopyrimidine deaminase/5-amino-6-(5-phosphoribosylamino)uracil reductase RibD [Alteromonas ponticola]NMH58918.1 bifunctional diaminohydroxyphosphoribosylaminopyrimidine deaminase/5-amino-6-(5-phosphoribosylamino)uracil reductase RibD [Alteromonas ponticola]
MTSIMKLAADSTLSQDYFWMGQAINLARKGRFTTSPNPNVGCVIVDDKQACVGSGYHLKAGAPHAEVHALEQAAEKAHGATAYVTLEPCSHFGKTPPCADALINAGIKKVVIAMTDPNPLVSGNGIAKLQQAGIEVVSDVMAAQAAELNKGFIKRMVQGKPFITVKLAVSLDGKVALANGKSQWITGPEARSDVHRHRAQSCAVLTGSGTVINDDPSLLVRPEEAKIQQYPLPNVRQPVRVVIDSKGVIPVDSQLLNDSHTTVIATTNQALQLDGNEIMRLPAYNEKVCLATLVNELGKRQMNHVWVEAGPGLAGALLQAGLVDELIVYQAPLILGDKAVSMMTLPDFSDLSQAYSLTLAQSRQVGSDTKMTFSVKA